MQTTIPLYGFGGGGGGTGAALTVTAPARCTVTVSKDGKRKTKVADTSGLAVFKGLSTGQWTVTITDGSQTAQKTVAVTADYATAITFFSATIHVTYPAGFICTATDGVTTLTAPDTRGTWDCVVPNAGTWTVTSAKNGWAEEVAISENGQEESVDVSKYWLYKAGKEYPDRTGGWSGEASKDSDGNIVFGASANTRFATVNKIDITPYTKLCANVLTSSANSSNSNTLIVTTTRNNYSTGPLDDLAFKTSGIVTLDVSNDNSKYYVEMYAYNYATMTVNEIWLE